jgi:enediyne biosynthesis protein E4
VTTVLKSRRKKLIAIYGFASITLIVVAVLIVFLVLPREKKYTPGEKIEDITSELQRNLPADYPRVTFVDAAKAVGISFQHFYGSRSTQLPEDMGSGAAWGDFDNDGDQDLYLCNIAGPLTFSEQQIASSPATNKLYRNDGNGKFTDITAASGVGYRGLSMGAAWADYDNDGYPDLFLSNYGTNVLYHNERNGTFRDVTGSARIRGNHGFWTGASWADYDLDGDLDLYVCGYVQYRFKPEDLKESQQYNRSVPFTLNPSSYEPERNLLYRNNGDGTFTEVAEKAGVTNPQGRSLSAAWCDFNNDGLPDLYVANDISDNAMYMNLGNGHFRDVSESAWVADYRGAMGLAIGDWNNDGDMDIFITHWLAQENAFYDNLLISPASVPKKEFTHFTDLADRVGLGQIALDYIGWGTSFFDYDNDGKRDLLVVNGSTFQDEKDKRHLLPMRNLLFWNQGETTGFFEVGGVSGAIFNRLAVGRGAAFADYDGDGDMDAIIVNHSGQAVLLRNEGGNRKNWLRVKVHGTKNHFGVGSRVEIIAGNHKQIDVIGAQPSYLSQNEMVAHFGLGAEKRADRVRVLFPGGKKVELADIKANQTIEVREP